MTSFSVTATAPDHEDDTVAAVYDFDDTIMMAATNDGGYIVMELIEREKARLCRRDRYRGGRGNE